MIMINNTITGGFLCRIAWKGGDALKKRCRPQDFTAKIEMEKPLDNLKFLNAKDFYNEVIRVIMGFKVPVNQTELIMLLAKKVTSQLFSGMILEHLKKGSRRTTLRKSAWA